MSYLISRVTSAVKHLLTPRGILILLTAIVTTGSLLTADRASTWLAVVGVGSMSILLVLMSVRQSEDHALLANLRRRHRKLVSAMDNRQPTMDSAAPVALEAEAVHVEQLARARSAILAVRNALPQTPPPGEAPSSESAPAVLPLSGPKVTVVVPCYNEAQFLAGTLESVRRQSFTGWECIIVDDASTDTSVAEAMQFV